MLKGACPVPRPFGPTACAPFEPVNIPDVLDHLEDVFFYMKGTDGRWRHCNAATLALLGAADQSEIVGRTDHDFFPTSIAQAISGDDAAVIRTGVAIRNKLEVIVDERGQVIWVETTKVPARTATGDICGIIGITRVVETTRMLPDGYRQFAKVIAHIQDHYQRPIAVEKLAAIACLSESHFRKRFVALFRVPPQTFVARIRVQAAAALLATTDRSIADIALGCGYSDQSYFTRQFGRFFGTTPRTYRARWSVKHGRREGPLPGPGSGP